MSDKEKLAVLRIAVIVAMRQLDERGVRRPDCPECGRPDGSGGLLDVHTVGCSVWKALYG